MIVIIPLGVTGEQTFSTICEVSAPDGCDPKLFAKAVTTELYEGLDCLCKGLTEEVVNQLLVGDPL